MSQSLRKAFPQLQAIIEGSTFADREGWIELTRRALEASNGRGTNMAGLNRLRAAAQNADLDAAVKHVLGVLPLDGHGVATVVQKRLRTAVRKGELSSTLGCSGEPGLRAINRSLDRLAATQIASPVLAERPEALFTVYSSASPSTT